MNLSKCTAYRHEIKFSCRDPTYDRTFCPESDLSSLIAHFVIHIAAKTAHIETAVQITKQL